ncbi:MAG: hypothetical protein ABIG11_02680 [bacterium]
MGILLLQPLPRLHPEPAAAADAHFVRFSSTGCAVVGFDSPSSASHKE